MRIPLARRISGLYRSEVQSDLKGAKVNVLALRAVGVSLVTLLGVPAAVQALGVTVKWGSFSMEPPDPSAVVLIFNSFWGGLVLLIAFLGCLYAYSGARHF